MAEAWLWRNGCKGDLAFGDCEAGIVWSGPAENIPGRSVLARSGWLEGISSSASYWDPKGSLGGGVFIREDRLGDMIDVADVRFGI